MQMMRCMPQGKGNKQRRQDNMEIAPVLPAQSQRIPTHLFENLTFGCKEKDTAAEKNGCK
ncbi:MULTISPECIES: hypothetical protein [unclassified Leisingera]|uniref:hypothetical protein n=1 Tax=Leisingera sp. HS039 TaxID=2818496 RepID=UPI001FFC7996|nr:MULTISPECIES: hypothetical protein [unclassified Leisingera]